MTGRSVALPAACVVVAAVALVAAACDVQPTAVDERIVLLALSDGPPILESIDDGERVRLTPPDDEASVLGVGPAGQLAVLSGGARLSVAGPGDDHWSEVDLGAIPADPSSDPLQLAWSPDGRLAVLAGLAETAELSGIVILDPAAPPGRWVPLALGYGGFPPTWLGPDRLVIPTRDDLDRPTASVVDTADGLVDTVVAGARAVAASADGATLAVLVTDGRTVLIQPTEAWLRGAEESPLARLDAGSEGSVEALAMDPAGGIVVVAASSSGSAATGPAIRAFSAAEDWAVALTVPLDAGQTVTSLGIGG